MVYVRPMYREHFIDLFTGVYWSAMALSVARLVTITCYCLSTMLALDARLTPQPAALPTVHRQHRNKSTPVNADLITAVESTSNGQFIELRTEILEEASNGNLWRRMAFTSG